MKNAKELFQDINEVLDGYHYYTREEVKENEQLFISAINEKDYEYINEVLKNFDSDIEEEKAIIENINYLMTI